MKIGRHFLCLALLGLLQPACKSWANLQEHKVTVQGPERATRGQDYSFTVYVNDMAGQTLKKIEYEYKIEWVGIEGSTHKGKSGILEKIRVKGNAGTATLSIIGYDTRENFDVIVKHPFEVQ
jgi:hypothetical protein